MEKEKKEQILVCDDLENILHKQQNPKNEKRVRINPKFSRFFIITNRINDAILALVFCYFFKILLKYGFIEN